ncbi:MAG: protein-L-isoaspartate O-methyltransferase [Treponema sp.]|nr:protein-L-isoaspartate O-methyltransferase [Treponema sp.]
MKLFKISVSTPVAVGLVTGLVIGVVAILIISGRVSSSSERVVAYEEVVESIIEQPLEPSKLETPPEEEYDGPQLAQSMPIETKETWLSWMQDNRNDAPAFLGDRWKLAHDFVLSNELKRPEDVRAFLLSPREYFVRSQNKGLEYADTWLPIGYGATITDPDVVAMMTSTLNINPGDKVLEIGTGSGYQSSILCYLTNKVYTIEIIKPLFAETDNLLQALEKSNPAYGAIKRKLGDGYYGWEEYAPFDKIIVTCAVDHIPPPLLKQLSPGGIMVLPLGPPGRQYIMEVKKEVDLDGSITLSRRDVYNGMRVSFIPFRNEAGASYSTSEPVEKPPIPAALSTRQSARED